MNLTVISKGATTINVYSGRRSPSPFGGIVFPNFGDSLPATDPPKPERTAEIVSDPRTGLEWSDTLGDSRLSFADAEKACAALRLGGHDDWRLPTLQELQGLVDYSRHDPAIDTTLFPATKSEAYWSASPVAAFPDCAWLVGFSDGHVYYNHRGSHAWVRAVRGPRASQ